MADFPFAEEPDARDLLLVRAAAITLAFGAAACDEPAGAPPEPPVPPDAKPSVAVVQPVLPPEAGGRLLAGRAPVQARCEEAPVRCASLEVFVDGARVASGTDRIDASVSLAGVAADSVRFRIVATGVNGQVTTVETGWFQVEPSPLWTEVLNVPGWLRDATLDRAETQLTFDTATAAFSPKTDGTHVVYTRRAGVGSARTYTLVLLTPAGEAVLAGPRPADDPRHDHEQPFRYQAEAGWVVWQTGPGADAELRARSPAGEVRPLSVPGSRGVLRAMGPAGQVVVESGGRWYYAATPHSAAVDFGRARARGDVVNFDPEFRWIGGKPYVIHLSSFFRIDV